MMEDMSHSGIIQRRGRVCLSLSLSFSLNALCHGGTAILSPSVSFIRPCVTMRLQCAWPGSAGGIAGIPVCGRGLVPGSPSFHRLSPSCTLLPSLPPSPNLSLSLVRSELCFTFVSWTKGTFLSLSPRWWLTANWDVLRRLATKATLKTIHFWLINRLRLHHKPHLHLRLKHFGGVDRIKSLLFS